MADRWCENCGAKMTPRWPRQNTNGRMLCPMCANAEGHSMSNRVAIRLHQGPAPYGSRPEQLLKCALASRKPSIIRVAHDSGDGETLFHCPFCGSGQIVARSDGAVDCDFCNTAFTVQVQPQMPAFPQTINGVPIDVPGMPKGGEDADVPPDEAAAAGYPPDGGGSDPNDPNADDPSNDDNPFGNGGGDNAAPDDGGDDDGGNPFAKSSALRVTSGRLVSPDQYIQHLALLHTPDRKTTLARVRAQNRS